MVMVFAALVLSCLWSFVLPHEQGNALYALKISLGASHGQLADWNIHQIYGPCSLSQVVCNDDNDITSVTLSSMKFTGTLSPRLGVLKTLVTLTLKGNGITGGIPEEFGNLYSLTNLDLENNRLTGEMPSALGNLKKLQFLTLSGNNLSGTIPESLEHLPKLINLQLDSNNLTGEIPKHLFRIPKYNFTGNNLNCGEGYTHPCESEDNGSGEIYKPTAGIIVGIVAGIIVLISGVLSFLISKVRHKGYKRDVFVDVEGEVDKKITFSRLRRFSWRELQVATNNFSEENIVGQGGFGKVYKGVQKSL